MGLEQPVHDVQAHPRSARLPPGREERLEDARPVTWLNPRSIVGHEEAYPPVAGLGAQPYAPRAGLGRIADELTQHDPQTFARQREWDVCPIHLQQQAR